MHRNNQIMFGSVKTYFCLFVLSAYVSAIAAPYQENAPDLAIRDGGVTAYANLGKREAMPEPVPKGKKKKGKKKKAKKAKKGKKKKAKKAKKA
ncbi:hypothetical protein HK103_001309 [Boothiomyces macroporosus]|uniref:Uncharacterized protein n=1 Tax=Boothiomyces macroporosus TaxID=261099 RepID=A0AAD5Y5F5_9FUNG|nr:hypothetical protein HK103_001309 [Boothiomyces macroporosus]